MPVIYLVVSITIIWLSLVTMLYNFSTNRTWSLLEIYNTFFLNKSALLSLGYCLVSGCQMIIFRLYCSIFLLYFFFLKKKRLSSVSTSNGQNKTWGRGEGEFSSVLIDTRKVREESIFKNNFSRPSGLLLR